MRRTRYLLPVAAVLGLAGFGRATRAETTLTVHGAYCNNGGGGFYGCYADVSGGTGSYVDYRWRFTEYTLGGTYHTNQYGGPDGYVTGTCTVGRNVAVTVTVTDSNGAKATGNGDFYCSQWAD
jgi:hypothetical protein